MINIEQYFKTILPKLIAISFILINIIPFYINGMSEFTPHLNMITIFYWSICKPSVISTWLIILLSIYEDVLTGMPIGFNIISNMVLYRLISNNRKIFADENFQFIWYGFIIFSFIGIILKYMTASVIFWNLFSIKLPLIQFLLTIILYPILHIINNKINGVTSLIRYA